MALDPGRLIDGDLFDSDDFQSQGGEAPRGPAPQRVGDYEVLGELARGGMGMVLVARDPRLNRKVAIKLLLASRFDSEPARQRFRLEAESLARLRHPHVVGVHASGLDRGRPYLVMDLVEGETLEERLTDRGPLSCEEAAQLGIELADALEHAHEQGVVHRDLKPANVILTPEGGAKLTDFGLARQLDAASGPSRSGQLLGTPGFWAPEQLGGPRDRIGPHTDVYGLGATLFAALTGEPPFDGESLVQLAQQAIDEPPRRPSSVNPQVDARLNAICLRCLAKEPGARYASAGELGEALRRYQAGDDGPGSRLRWRAAALVVALLGGLVAALGLRPVATSAPSPLEGQPAAESPPERAWETCLRVEAPTDEQLARAERELWELADAGEPCPPARLEAMPPGPARWRLRTLALVLAEQAPQAHQELEGAGSSLASRLRQLVEAGRVGSSVRSLKPAREFGAALVAKLIEELRQLLEQAERLPQDPDIEAVRRWSVAACQEGVARLAVLARDVTGSRWRTLGLELPRRWAQRARELAPGTPTAGLVVVASAWTHVGEWKPESEPERARAYEEVRSLHRSGVQWSPWFEYMAQTILSQAHGQPGPEQLDAATRALTLLDSHPELAGRYPRYHMAIREQVAGLALKEGWESLERGESAGELLVQSYRAGWRAMIVEKTGAGAISRLDESAPPLTASAAEVRQALAGRSVMPRPAGILAVVLILADRPDAAGVLLGQVSSGRAGPMIGLLEAELLMIQGRVDEARLALERLAADPALASAEAWAALAHSSSLVADAGSPSRAAEAAIRATDSGLRRIYVPWHDPERLEALLTGEAWWPGVR